MKTLLESCRRNLPGLLLITIAGLPYLTLLAPVQLHHELLKEDGLFENGSALFWLISSVICFYLYATDRKGCDLLLFKSHRNIFFLLLAIMFFLGFGEEISWGQRIFNIPTPEPIKEINEQGELNLHNLAGFQIEHLFSLFWLIYAFVVPLSVRLVKPVSDLFGRMNLPIVPLWLGMLFPVNYLVSKLFQPFFSGTEYNFPIEAKEFVFALLFTAASMSFLRICKKCS